MTEKYIMMNIDDSKMKHLAEVLSNPTSKKILDLLAEQELSESEIADKLKSPLNTIDYNVKKLMQAGLIETASHWWSVKGKKIPTYKLSNKKIIISPRTSKWKSIVPAVLAVGVVSVVLKYYFIAQDSVRFAVDNVAQKASEGTLGAVSGAAAPVANNFISVVTNSGNWLWFLTGGLVALIIFILLNWRKL